MLTWFYPGYVLASCSQVSFDPRGRTQCSETKDSSLATQCGAESLRIAATVYYPLTDDEGGEQAAGAWHGGIAYELVLALDAPVLQMVEQTVDVLDFFDTFLPVVVEQVIEVPKVALQDGNLQRAVLRAPQLVEQLVEVPTVPFFRRAQR